VIDGKRVIAVVPARSGSKGIVDKNMRLLAGTSLIGWAGKTLASVAIVDVRIISTDSARYATEGERHGLSAPFLRPAGLSTDSASSVDTLRHAVSTMEQITGAPFDIVLVVEPTSPLRLPTDIERAARLLHSSGADSVVTVSPLSAKAHPHKILTVHEGRLDYFMPEGRSVVARQTLPPLFWRNGVCYALTRRCLFDLGVIIGPNSRAEVIDHPVANIDEPWELELAELGFPLPGINLD